LLISIWLYGYSRGISSARELSRQSEFEPGLLWLCGLQPISYRTLSGFRSDYQAALDDLFVQVLGMLSAEGLINGPDPRGLQPQQSLRDTGLGSVGLLAPRSNAHCGHRQSVFRRRRCAKQVGNDRWVPSEVKLAMGSRLQSNGTTQAAKVDTLIPSAIFHSFLTELTLPASTFCGFKNYPSGIHPGA
jgi:hypothetical protein